MVGLGLVLKGGSDIPTWSISGESSSGEVTVASKIMLSVKQCPTVLPISTIAPTYFQSLPVVQDLLILQANDRTDI